MGVLLDKVVHNLALSAVVEQVLPLVVNLIIDVLGKSIGNIERQAYDLPKVLQAGLQLHSGISTNGASKVIAVLVLDVLLYLVSVEGWKVAVNIRHTVS